MELFSGVDDISVKVKGECISQAAKRPVEVTQIIDKLSKQAEPVLTFIWNQNAMRISLYLLEV